MSRRVKSTVGVASTSCVRPSSRLFTFEMRATGKPRDEAAKIFDQLVPLGRHTTPEEIAHAVLYLAADESAMMTSHTFTIDGGLSG